MTGGIGFISVPSSCSIRYLQSNARLSAHVNDGGKPARYCIIQTSEV